MSVDEKLAVERIDAWIESVLDEHRSVAEQVSHRNFPRLPLYFHADTLRNARFVVTARLPIPRLAQFDLSSRMEELPGDSEGITLVDTFFVLSGHEHDEALFFHELVHVVQWSVLGRARFIASYLRGLGRYGYHASPLEAMAYSLQAMFESGRAPFSVEAHVLAALRAGS